MRYVIFALLLTGCVNGVAQMHDKLQFYRGKNIKALIYAIGYPASTQEVLGDTVYTFSISNPATGYACTIQAATEKDGTIKDFHGGGNNGGCQPYADRL